MTEKFRLSLLSALFLHCLQFAISSHHHGIGGLLTLPEVSGIEPDAAAEMSSSIHSTVSSIVRLSMSVLDSVNVLNADQSAFLRLNLMGRDSISAVF